MKTIKIKHPHYHIELPKLSLALGFFDGVHAGHQTVIEKAKEEAKKRGIKSGVMTFFPHPKEVLRKDSRVRYLTSMKQKQALIEMLGVDYLIIIDFDNGFSELTPQQFVDYYLIGLNVKHVVAGFDYTYGRLGKGTMETLPFHSRNKLTYTTVGKVEFKGEKISSTSIRQALEDGNLSKVNRYLGRNYETEGVVVHGEKRGRTIGFPTANVQLEARTYIPAVGVYFVRLFVNNEWYDGVCNIGYKPTFHNDKEGAPVVEVHLLHFNDNIYGSSVKIQWMEKIRDEKKFDSVNQLINQLEKDVQAAKNYFATEENSTSFCNNP
ncbi:bifunctional riboflavin kinase/FAD synthetase [Evansella vedderi]|uniref:bifunctional riboflavin kinase/FAD synthetase n=1 Tax=Evansella vedderi TaxID=38282 RepID=UPI0027D793E3|nr:bifunctional riboflavin kinase/FAD synthetase [Evansella vedderi]